MPTDSPTRVVVADDSALMRSIVTASLQKAGVKVVGSARDGDEALALCEREQPDAITLDLAMPGLDGLGVLRALRLRGGDSTPVVVVSAFSPAHGARAGQSDRYITWRAFGRFCGTTPVSGFLAWREELDEQDRRDWIVRGTGASATAMLGRFDEARAMIADLRADLAERGGGLPLAGISGEEAVEVELLAGDPGAAAALAEGSCRLLEELGQRSVLSTVAARLAQVYYQLDRLEEADAWAGRALGEGASDDAITQMLWRQARAKVLARRGRHAEAEVMAREAVAIGARTEMLNAQADADADLAEVLWLAGHPEDAAQALEEALTRYQRKENLVMAERMRVRLTQWRGR